MLSRDMKVLNTNGLTVKVNSASTCNYNQRNDLTAVATKDGYFIVSNYIYADGEAYFEGEYVEVNKDLFYLMSTTYSAKVKDELFGVNMLVYEGMLSDIVQLLKPNSKQIERLSLDRKRLPLEVIRNEIQNRLLGFKPVIDSHDIAASLDNIYKPNLHMQCWYGFLMDAIKEGDTQDIVRYAKKLNFEY